MNFAFSILNFQFYLHDWSLLFFLSLTCYFSFINEKCVISSLYPGQIQDLQTIGEVQNFSPFPSATFFCLQSLATRPTNSKFLILTDSLSALHSLTNPYSIQPLVQRIHLTLHLLFLNNIEIVSLWILSHIGIRGNDLVDTAAKAAIPNSPKSQTL